MALHRAVRKNGAMPVRDCGEIGPDLIVEEMLAKDIEDLERGDQFYGATAKGEHVVGEEADVFYVIEVRMRNEDIVDLALLLEGERARGGTGINEDVLVEEEARGIKAGSDTTIGPEYTQFLKVSPNGGRFLPILSIVKALMKPSTTFSSNWVPRLRTISAKATS